jgi:hypothetical protein
MSVSPYMKAIFGGATAGLTANSPRPGNPGSNPGDFPRETTTGVPSA